MIFLLKSASYNFVQNIFMYGITYYIQGHLFISNWKFLLLCKHIWCVYIENDAKSYDFFQLTKSANVGQRRVVIIFPSSVIIISWPITENEISWTFELWPWRIIMNNLEDHIRYIQKICFEFVTNRWEINHNSSLISIIWNQNRY